jgi:hypothetical protein
MPKDPTIAVRDCLAEIAILSEIEARMTLQAFRNDPIARRAAAYDDAILWEIITTDTHSVRTVMEAMLERHVGEDPSQAAKED